MPVTSWTYDLHELKMYQKSLSNSFSLYTAFSRQSGQKVYVQHRLAEHAAELCTLLLDCHGYLYICGDACMAGDVKDTLCQVLSQELKVTSSESQQVLREMKNTGRYQVWLLMCFALSLANIMPRRMCGEGGRLGLQDEMKLQPRKSNAVSCRSSLP